jgi:hypothetical protein
VFVATVAKQSEKEKENFGGKKSQLACCQLLRLDQTQFFVKNEFLLLGGLFVCHRPFVSLVRTFIFSALKNKYFGMVLIEKTQKMILSTKVTFSLKKTGFENQFLD